MVKPINQIPNIEVAKPEFLPAIESGVAYAEALYAHRSALRISNDAPRQPLIDLALGSSLHSVNALLAMAAATCRIGAPPTADIEMVTDSSGSLIYRCTHANPHKWDMGGSQTP